MPSVEELLEMVPLKMTALGIRSDELASSYARMPTTTFRRMMRQPVNGLVRKLEEFDETLNELAELEKQVWPVPIDWEKSGQVHKLQERLKFGTTVISNTDGAKPPEETCINVLIAAQQKV
jgi:hypothetical protein